VHRKTTKWFMRLKLDNRQQEHSSDHTVSWRSDKTALALSNIRKCTSYTSKGDAGCPKYFG